MGAVCTTIISGKRKEMSEAEWLSIRVGRISMNIQAWTKTRIFIEDTCARIADCSVGEMKKNLDAFELEMNLL